MAAGNVTLNALPATIECTDAEFRIVINGANVHLTNVGTESVFLKFSDDGDLDLDGLQHNGEIQLDPNDTVPIPSGSTFVRHQCDTGKVTKMWYIPSAA